MNLIIPDFIFGLQNATLFGLQNITLYGGLGNQTIGWPIKAGASVVADLARLPGFTSIKLSSREKYFVCVRIELSGAWQAPETGQCIGDIIRYIDDDTALSVDEILANYLGQLLKPTI